MKKRIAVVTCAVSMALYSGGIASAGPAEEIENREEGSGELAGGSETKEADPEENGADADEILIRMVGDDLIHQPIFSQSLLGDGSYDFDLIFAPMKEDFESADVAILNQETILIRDYSQVSSYPMFGSPDALGHSIAKAGFDVVAHATNHTMDKGVTGILDTIRFWETNYPQMLYLGIHKDAADSDIRYMDVKGVRLGFVNYTYGLNGLEGRRRGREYLVDLLGDGGIEGTLHEARDNSDFLIAILHAGNEYVHTPTAYQRQQIQRFIDNGADIVFCAHPHVLEPYQMLTTPSGNTGLVYYSLGNYVSAQNDLACVLGGMAEVRLKRGEDGIVAVSDYDLVPLVTHQEFRNFTTYKLADYPAELEARHELRGKGLSAQALWELFGRAAPRW